MNKDKKTKGRPNEIDIYVGKRIRELRQAQDHVKQESIAAAIGVTFQQVQKYEMGKNRISAGNLFKLSKFFGKPLEAFFPEE